MTDEKIRNILRKYFNHDDFRHGQIEVIKYILSGGNCLAVFPTGGGKSICFQIPALIMKGSTIVISPLISLMKDQVDALKSKGIKACLITGDMTSSQTMNVLEDISKGMYKLIYIAPERLQSNIFMRAISRIKIPFVVIDEAHCLPNWGMGFRPSYMDIKPFLERLHHPVTAAFTATADKIVRGKIIRYLGLKKGRLFIGSFDRPNIKFSVRNFGKNDMKREIEIVDYVIANEDKSGIIYTLTRKDAEDIYNKLSAAGIKAGYYHAGESYKNRNKMQKDFLSGKIKVMAATNAFGMGIDKENIRYVLHMGLPKSLEAYYQEAGRAGRDGNTAECLLLSCERDMRINKYLINSSYPDISDVRMVYDTIKEAGNAGIYSSELYNAFIESDIKSRQASARLLEFGYIIKNKRGRLKVVEGLKWQLKASMIEDRKKEEQKRLLMMEAYSKLKSCRRKYILEYFGDDYNDNKCGNCDMCL